MIQTHPKQLSGTTYSQQLIKDRNETLLFNLVRKMAPISRADLARVSGLSPATVTVLVEELLNNQWLRELSPVIQAPQRGRRPILLEANASRGFVVTLEILSRGYICTLYDICLNRIEILRGREQAPSALHLCQTIHTLMEKYGIADDRLLGIHVLYPGLFDTDTNELGFSAVIDEADMIQSDLLKVLQQRFPLSHCMLSNISTAMAYSVFTTNTPQASLPLLALSIHEGISAGIVTIDRVCTPLEAGHIIVHPNGIPCQCGNRGCLETVCSTAALFQAINERTHLDLKYQTTYGAECNQEAILVVAEALAQGDPEVTAVLADYANSLCCGLVSMSNLLAVQSVYIGGTIRLLGDPFLQLLRKTLNDHFQIVTNSRCLNLELFDDDQETSRKAAVVLTLEQLFQKN